MTQIDDTFGPYAASSPRYDTLTQAIHWLSLIVFAIAFIIGLVMEDMPREFIEPVIRAGSWLFELRRA